MSDPTPDLDVLAALEQDMRRALYALRLEVPASVGDDVTTRVLAAYDAQAREAQDWRTGKMADATGHMLRCAKINGTWSCADGCQAREAARLKQERDWQHDENVSLIARLAACERERDAWRDTCSRQEEETGRAHRERDALRAALAEHHKYRDHTTQCGICGLDQAYER